MSTKIPLSSLGRSGHSSHCRMCLLGLPFSQVEVDSSRIAVVFYCLGTLDLLGVVESKTSEIERETWRAWLWEQQTSSKYGTGFQPSPYMTTSAASTDHTEYDVPHLIMTYTAILSLAILRDDFKQLDRSGIVRFLQACQQEDGSFSALPNGGESDLRMMYCAFVISSMLNDWSGVDIDRAVAYIQRCSSYEGGYGQTPFGEALGMSALMFRNFIHYQSLGGTTYCAIASLHLVPDTPSSPISERISPIQRARTIRWLAQNQTSSGGFCGRTAKDADACYCFWCGASLSILGEGGLVDEDALAAFLLRCQFKFGGIAKAPGERPDPYHTYLSLAVLATLPPHTDDTSWKLPCLDTLWNATQDTTNWIKSHISDHNDLGSE
ncbi:Geranylgeranyl transferase type-1 subunit beta [Grifola frondosa]|uniref:Geranylgeranyl transferase type-1 subunit beta n=1 Tax=Grifola frondosa TaxID=5627 RepID=A0A1C7M441_GRIFR|nr:Geranylgeranyl transferase type-1 subunit beta [Grifola frondosa]